LTAHFRIWSECFGVHGIAECSLAWTFCNVHDHRSRSRR